MGATLPYRRLKAKWVPRQARGGGLGYGGTRGHVYEIKAWRQWGDPRKLRALRDIVEEAATDPSLRWFVVNEVLKPAGVEQRDYEAQAAAMLRWVQEHIYYTNEPGEQVQTPYWTLQSKTGDCDDSAVLLASFAQAIGLPWRFVLAGKDRAGRAVRFSEGGRFPRNVRFAHIYVEMGWPPFRPRFWKSAEPTLKKVPLGYDVVRNGPPTASPAGLPELGDVGALIPGGGYMPHVVQVGAMMQRGMPLYDPYSKSIVLTHYLGPDGLGSDAIPVAVATGQHLGPVAPRLADVGLRKWIPWRDIISGVTQGVLIGVILHALNPRKGA